MVSVTVYGLVVQVKCANRTKLIKLISNFSTGECAFLRCRKELDLDLLLNVVVAAL